MPPKKRKPTEDIRPFLNKKTVSSGGSSSTKSTQADGASTSQVEAPSLVRVKKEMEDDSEQGPHSHQFKVKFQKDEVEYTIDCDQPRTVLEVIKLHLNEQFQMMKDKRRNYSDEKIVIQRSKENKQAIVATHFPCSCIENGECLVIHCKTEEVQETKSQHGKVLSRDKYSVFYIATKAGINARKDKLFKSKTVKEFDYLCVFAKKGTSVKEALERDGRFNDLKDFKLSEVENSNQHTLFTQKVDNLDQKKFKICRDRKPANYENEQVSSEQEGQEGQQGQEGQEGQEGQGGQQGQPSTSKQSQQKFSTKSVLDAAQKSGFSVKRVMEETGSEEEIYKILCKQFQDLKSLMKKRFPGDSYQEALELKKVNFGEIQQSFSEVHRLSKLLKLGESVCKVIVSDVCQGTGFVLFDRLILTNAHLFKDCVTENKLQEDIEVYALFNYDKPEPFTKYYIFTAEKTFIDFDLELDYAILELNPQGQKHNQTGEAKVPPGLLSKFSLPPDNGEACLIGHPAGKVKQIDPTCIIPIEKRVEAVDKHLHPYKDTLFTLQSISHLIQKQDTESIMIGGSKADKVVTYNTFMYHGASGSPVFDVHCSVFGLHTAGFCYGFPKERKSVIEFALPLKAIFENFVDKVKKSRNKELLERIQEEVKGNLLLKKFFEHTSQTEQLNDEEPMETSEPTRSEAPQ